MGSPSTCTEVEPSDDRVRAMLDEDRIGNLTIAGELANADPNETTVVIDDPESPAGLLVRTGWVRIYARDVAALHRLLPAIKLAAANDESEELGFAGVAAWVRDEIAQSWALQWENPCWLYYFDPGCVEGLRVMHEVRSLTVEQAGLVNEHWGAADSEEYVRSRIEDGPSAAVWEEGRPVSWALTHDDGQLGMMFTLPGARRMGYARSVTAALVEQLLAAGKTPFLYTSHSNVAAQHTAERFSFRRWGDYRWFGAIPHSRA